MRGGRRAGRKGAAVRVWVPYPELLPQLPVDVLLACMQEPDQTSAVRALRAALPPAHEPARRL